MVLLEGLEVEEGGDEGGLLQTAFLAVSRPNTLTGFCCKLATELLLPQAPYDMRAFKIDSAT